MKLEEIYQQFDEEQRINTTKANSIEFLTTDKFIQKYLKTGMHILDIGAATGKYSIHYAKQGYAVTAVEPVEKNLSILKQKITDQLNVTPILGNALDLSMLKDNSFDLTLCMGPFYHLKTEQERDKCIRELQRVTKPDGIILIAYISNDMVLVSETMKYNSNILTNSNLYNPTTGKVVDEPFTMLTYGYMQEYMKKVPFLFLEEFAQDGLSELFSDKINKMNDQEFHNWYLYHLYTCQKPELIGYSNHIAMIFKNSESRV